MSDSNVRALCARIALELNPERTDALIAQLKVLLNGEDMTVEGNPSERPVVPQYQEARAAK